MSTFTTKRLIAEPLSPNHADVMYPILQDIEIYKFIDEEPPESLDTLRKRYEFLSPGKSPDGSEDWLNWIIYKREGNEPIGFVQATVRQDDCSIAFVFNPKHWRQGMAHEATEAMIDYLFDTYPLTRIVAEIDPDNAASKRLVKRLGFSFVHHDEQDNDDVFNISLAEWINLRDTRKKPREQ